MSSKTRVLIAGVFIGMAIGVLFGVIGGYVYWAGSNPSISEMESAVEENMNLDDEQLEDVMSMVKGGVVIDLGFHLILVSTVSGFLGSVIGLVGGIIWYKVRINQKISDAN